MSNELISRGHSKLTLAGAKLMLEAAEQKAREMGLGMDIAICGEGEPGTDSQAMQLLSGHCQAAHQSSSGHCSGGLR